MKISLITACYNSAATIRTCFDSVLSQQDVDLEYIVVDGGSKDGTVSLIQELQSAIGNREQGTGNREDNGSTRSTCSTRLTFKWLSEPDQGMYDAINKGIKMATGDIVGILNADDMFESENTLAHVAEAFNHVGQVEHVGRLRATTNRGSSDAQLRCLRRRISALA